MHIDAHARITCIITCVCRYIGTPTGISFGREGGREGYGRPRERTEPFEFDAICMILGDLHGYLHGYCMYLDDLQVFLHMFK